MASPDPGSRGLLRVGLNPYGLTYYLGLQGRGTARANPEGRGLEGFIALGEELGARTLEIFEPWLATLGMTPVVSGGHLVAGPLDGAFRAARLLEAKIIRVALTPVLCGDRNACGAKWDEYVTAIRAALTEWGPRAMNAGVHLCIENHQDFGSDELVAFCERGGPGIGITYDTGNSFPVAEAPLDFTRVVAPHVRHLHLKDYRIQFTPEGYRLVRCAIGDGAVPFTELVAILDEHHDQLGAVLEPGALEARHVRLLTDDWWNGYPPRSARSLAACLRAAEAGRMADDEDYRTPWERGDDTALETYELDMIRRSVANMKTIGLI